MLFAFWEMLSIFFLHDDWSSTESIHIFLCCNFHTDSVVPVCNNNNEIICIRNRYLRIVVPVRQDHQHSGQSYFPGRGHLRPLYAQSRFNNNQNKCFAVVYFSLRSWWQKCSPSGWMAWMWLVGMAYGVVGMIQGVRWDGWGASGADVRRVKVTSVKIWRQTMVAWYASAGNTILHPRDNE